MTQRPLRWGMVGGGPGAGIAAAHRTAARLDGQFSLVAGAFSRHAAKSRAMGQELGLAADRVYADFASMAAAESQRPDGIECVSIVTPNDSHAAASLAFIGKGIHVICDKPMATTLDAALEVDRAATARDVFFGLTHNYGAYPLIFEARHLVSSGELGAIRLVQVEYALGGRNRLVEKEGDPKMVWRADPAICGASVVLADVGTHAHHLMRRMTGLEVEAVSAELMTLVPGRAVDDNAYVNLRFAGGARGHLWASVMATGNGHGLRVRIFGEKASLHWDQEHPNELRLCAENAPHRVLRRGDTYLCDAARRQSRTKAGNPEGYFEAFANVYSDSAEAIRAKIDRRAPDPLARAFATARDGVLGMRFIEAAVESHRSDGAWTSADVETQEGT
jgi:predicted dehydrogenase